MNVDITVRIKIRDGSNQTIQDFVFDYYELMAMNEDGKHFDMRIEGISRIIADGLTQLGFNP